MSHYAWLKDGGWWFTGGEGAKPTHLLLDGGKARVPDDAAGAFLNAYALAVVRAHRPCVVELRTPIFRLFLDLDVKIVKTVDTFDFGAVMALLQQRATAMFGLQEPPRAVVCATQPREVDGCIKAGKHVVWTNVFVTSSTALAFRQAVVTDLDAAMPDACTKPWSTVVDACVFQANGLRMPFSEKGRCNSATYVPTEVWLGEASTTVEEEAVRGVSAVRGWVRELSIRTFGKDETPLAEGVEVALEPEEGTSSGVRGTTKSLAPYSSVLPALDAALPVEFAGQRFTSLVQTDTCFLLRSSGQYCLNLGRRHNSCGTYFVLTRKGVRQKCFCRCETTEGRKYGMCKDFGSEVWPVPPEVTVAFFGEEAVSQQPSATEFKPNVMPSIKAKAAMDLDAMLSRSRMPPKALKSKKRRVKM